MISNKVKPILFRLKNKIDPLVGRFKPESNHIAERWRVAFWRVLGGLYNYPAATQARCFLQTPGNQCRLGTMIAVILPSRRKADPRLLAIDKHRTRRYRHIAVKSHVMTPVAAANKCCQPGANLLRPMKFCCNNRGEIHRMRCTDSFDPEISLNLRDRLGNIPI